MRSLKKLGALKTQSFNQYLSLGTLYRQSTQSFSFFSQDKVKLAPPDPILGVTEAFKKDQDPNKLNLGVGAYRTEELKPYLLPVVQKAQERVIAKQDNKEYLPIDGLPAFKEATGKILLGNDSNVIKENRIASLQSLSGTGSLRLGAGFINAFFPDSSICLPTPTWSNHKTVFSHASVPQRSYKYYEPKTIGLDFEGFLEDIKAQPAETFILLHGCAHNPTGIDLTEQQWEILADVILQKKLIPFFDVAYQGFASGNLDQDAKAVRIFAEKKIEMLVAQSYAKNMGLYGERIGALNFIGNDKETCDRVASQLKVIARGLYSSPPLHGAAIVAEVVNDPQFYQEWQQEMEKMSGRIKKVRLELQQALEKLEGDRDWSFITKQIGMFSFTGLTPKQVENMKSKHHVYLTSNGRISLAGLSSSKVDYLAKAIVDSVKVKE